MKQKLIIVLFVILATGYTVKGQGNYTPPDSIRFKNSSFSPGEKLIYKVKYGLVPGGYASLTTNLEKIGFNWYYAVKAVARTDGLVGKVTYVRDRYESYIDIATGLPIRAVRDIRENNYRKFNEVLFRRSNNTVLSLTTGEHKVPPGTLDILSAFYYARRYIFEHEFKKNQTLNLTTFFDEEIYVIKIRYKEKEMVRTDFGKIECLKFVPVLEKGGPFEKEKDLRVWFSNDGNFIPLKIRLKIGIGKVKCDLHQYSGLKNSLGAPLKGTNTK
ncbi:MAG: DUF3108 domain-containing protein [Bacteroidota bacterium]|nr:DUF3108 domain-containing protein [Bacteroidota bacterium]